MERAIKRTFTILAIFILLCGITLNIGQISAFAAGEDIPKEGVTYTLTYPDGTVVTEKNGKPLTFDDVTEALKGENWRLLGSGYTSDKDGKAVLPSSWTEGTIKIIETKVPTGYTQGTDSTQIVDIKDGTVEFVNPKIKEEETTYSITYKLNGGEFNGSTEDIVEKYPEGTVIDIHEAPTREGYEFDYWEGSKYYPGDKYTVVEDHTLVAQWKENSDDNDIIDDEDNNNNDNDSDDTQKTDTTSDKSKKTVIKETKSVAATGDTADLSLYFGFFISSLLVIAFSLSYRFVFAASNNASINSRKGKGLIIAVIISMAAGIAMASIAYSAAGFTINKVDDNGDPVEGAVFDVYGKPAVSFEEKEQEKVNISGTKTWDDADDQDGKRPDSITVRLHADGKEVDSKVVTAEGDWKYFFTDKPKYEGNKEIAYSITEDAVADYQTKISGYDITNSYTPGKTSLTVTKVWNDKDDQDGIRPDSVKVNLLADGEKTKEATLSADSGWTYTFKYLDEKKDGETINYTVEEAEVPENYTAEVTGSAKEGFTIKNSHKPETVDIVVEKIWYDQDMFDAEGKPLGSYKRPDSVTITLWDEDKKEVVRAKVSEDTNWKHKWTLPKFKEGKEIDYQEYMVGEAEANVPVGFAQKIGHPSSEGEGLYTAAVLNVPKVREEYTPVEVKLVKYSEAKTIPATDGEEPRDVPLPGVEFTVTEDGAESDTPQTLTTDVKGKATFTADEPDQEYVVKETETREGYYNNGATFTLSVEKGKLESLVFDADKREWVKTYGLYTEALAEGKSPEDLTIETPQENENTYILRNKPLAKLVVEKYFTGADMSTYEDAPKEFAITLSYIDAAGNAQEKKLTVNGEYWQSGGDPSLCRWLVPGIPYNAKVKLKESGLGKQGYALTNTEAFVWRMDPNGPRYESDMADEAEISADKRTVTFNMPAHFDPDPAWKYSEEYGGGSLGLLGARVRFQNHYSTTIDITGTKLWRDGGRTHDNAKEVKLTLYRRASGSVADAEQVAGATPTWDGNKYTFADQPISDRSGNEYVYRVIEDRVEGYDDPKHSSADGDATGVPGAPNGGLIINELSQDYVDITVTKKWDDAGNQDSKRPGDLTLALYRTGKDGDETHTEKVKLVTPEVSKSGNDWTYTFKNQLKYDSQRYEFIYEVREETVPDGYTVSYADANGTALDDGAPNGGTITNKHTPETRSIAVEKVWKDEGYESSRPAQVQVTLYADGVDAEKDLTLDVSNNWKGSFDNLPKYKNNGTEIQYTVKETTPLGHIRLRSAAPGDFTYKTDITGNMTDGYVVTNTINRVNLKLTKIWEDENDKDKLRPLDDLGEPSQKDENGNYADKLRVERKIEGGDFEEVSWTPSVIFDFDKNYDVVFKNLPRFDAEGNEYEYRIVELPIAGYNTTEVIASGDMTSGFTLTNTHTPTVTVSGTKTWTSSTGNNDDLDTSKIPEKYTVRLEKSTDGTNWTTVTTQEVASYMAPPPMSPTDPIMPPDEWKFSNLPAKDGGVDIQYRVVEVEVPEGFTMSGGTKDANGKYNLTNTYTPATTSNINLNVNFTQSNSNLSWVAKTVPVKTVEPAQRTIKVGDQDIEVYMYTYSNPDETTYYGDMPYNYSVSHWYDASGNELDPSDALINDLMDNAVLVNEEVTRNVFGGLFKDNVTKTITVTGPNGFSKSYTITLGENSTFQIPITDAGEYTITQELVESGDIDNEAFAERNTGYTVIYSIQTAVVNVTKDGDNFTCAMNKNKTMVFEHEINSSSKPYTLDPFEGGDNPYAEINGWHYGDGTSAKEDTVTINHYMKSITEQ